MDFLIGLSGFPGNSCKQSSAQLINYTLSGKMKMPSNFSEDSRFPLRFILIKTWISENEKSVNKYSLFWRGKSTDELPA